jgi:hypothetical protein
MANEKCLNFFVSEINSESSSAILMVLDYDRWHNTNMPHDIFQFWSK